MPDNTPLAAPPIGLPAEAGGDGTRGTRPWALGVLAAAIVAASVWTLHNYLPALVWAAIFAIALWPLFQWLHNHTPRRGQRVMVPAVVTVAIALLFFLPLALLALQAAREAHGVLDWVQTVRDQGLPVPEFVSKLPFGADRVTEWWQANLASPGDASHLAAHVNRQTVVAYGRQAGAYLLHLVVLFGFMLLTLFFLLRDAGPFVDQLRRASRRAFGPGGERVGAQMIASVRGTVSGLVFVGLGEGLAIGIGYVIAGVPHPVLFGAVTAVASMLPFCGGIPIVIASALLLAQGGTLSAVLILAYGFAVTFIADHFIRPVLIGGATRLPFLLVLLGILGGIESWGLLGLFLGPALMAAMVLLWREWSADPRAHAAEPH
jgi:predicted PurR-regulated permease PerM